MLPTLGIGLIIKTLVGPLLDKNHSGLVCVTMSLGVFPLHYVIFQKNLFHSIGFCYIGVENTLRELAMWCQVEATYVHAYLALVKSATHVIGV